MGHKSEAFTYLPAELSHLILNGDNQMTYNNKSSDIHTLSHTKWNSFGKHRPIYKLQIANALLCKSLAFAWARFASTT